MRKFKFFSSCIKPSSTNNLSSFMKKIAQRTGKDSKNIIQEINDQHRDGIFWHTSRDMSGLFKGLRYSPVLELCASYLLQGNGANG